MRQRTLAMATGFERYGKKTRRAAFLEEMEQVVPWSALCALVEPHYPKAGNGRRPVGIERMLRIYFLQQWFSLSDPAAEEALYDSPLMRQFAQIDLGNEPVPDETTVCKFRHLLEQHQLGRRSEEHTSELQSRFDLVCRLLLEKKKQMTSTAYREQYKTTPIHIYFS